MTDTSIPAIDTRSDRHLQRSGILLTLGWLIMVAIYCKHDWKAVSTLKPQDLATFLGGVFAPLAFLWLVLGYFQQGFELRHSVEALRLQSVELANSVEQQRGLVEATREQIEHERQVATATEKALAHAASPIFRIKNDGTTTYDGNIQQEYIIQNFGPAARDVSILIDPDGHHQHITHLEGNDFIRFFLTHRKEAPIEAQLLKIGYRDQRNHLGTSLYLIPTAYIPGYGKTYGQPIEEASAV